MRDGWPRSARSAAFPQRHSRRGIPAEVLAQVRDPVLDMVRDVAHQVNRPAAPLTTFLVGLASGAASADGTDPTAQVNSRLEQIARLISSWEPTPSE